MRSHFLFRIVLVLSILLPVIAFTGLYVLAQDKRINYGDNVTGEIPNSGDTEAWNFDGTKGDTLTIQVARTGGNLVPRVTVQDSEGQTLVELDWPEQGPPTVLLSTKLYQTGTHAIIIQGDDNSTGTYTLSLEVSESANPSGTSSGILAYGEVVTGEIADSTFRQFWSFRGTRDDVIDINMTAASGDLDAYLSLTSPEGTSLYSTDSGGVGTGASIFAFKLPVTGTYTISAQRAGANFGERGTTQGTYNLALTLRTPGAEIAEATPVALTPGIEVRGQLTADAPIALYSVNMQQQAFSIGLDMIDPAQVITVSVMTPQRALLAAFSGIAPLRSGLVVPGQGGEVWVEVAALGMRESAPVDFALSVDQLATAQQLSRALQYGTPRQMSASLMSETNAWHFAGKTGDMVEVTILPYGPVLGDAFSIYAPDGTLLLQRAVNTGFVQPLALQSNGLYEVFLGTETVRTGYSISIEQVGALGRSFDQHAAAEVRGPLVPGIDHRVSGQLTTGQSDAWVFDIAEPQNWYFSFTETGSGLTPALGIEAPDGTWLGVMLANRLPGVNNLRVNLSSPGRYHAVIFEPSGQGGSTYTFYGIPVQDGTLPLRTVNKGSLSAQKPADFWNLAVPPDALLSVDMDLLTSGTLPYLHVIAPDGTLLASNVQGQQQNPASLSGVPTHEGGLFRIVVSQPTNALEVTPYHIQADIQTPFHTDASITADLSLSGQQSTPELDSTSHVIIAEQITPTIKADSALLRTAKRAEQGVLQRGTITEGALYEAWSFSARRGEMIEFSVVTFDAKANAPDLVILDQKGTVLAENFKTNSSTNYLMQRFENAGRYYVVVGLEHGGPYTLWLNELTKIDETVPVVLPGEVVSYGDTRFGEIVEPDNTSRYVFYGHEGDVTLARVVTIQGDLRLHLRLLDTEDNILNEVVYGEADVTTALENIRLPGDGVYQILVSPSETTTGQFAFHLNLEQAETLSNRGGGTLVDEQMRSLSRTDSVHRWLFDAQSGEMITIHLGAVSESLPSPLALHITDTAGNVFLQAEANIGNTSLEFERVLLPRTGIYQAVVTGGDQQSGIYGISLERDLSHTRDNPGAVRYGETVGQVLTPTNYLDVWTFAGSRGDMVSVSTYAVRGDTTAVLGFQVRTANGEILATTADDENTLGASVHNLTLPSDGFYSVVVGNLEDSFTGEVVYGLTVQLENTRVRSMGTVMHYGQVVEGNLYPDDLADVWLFEGQQGDVIAAEITAGTSTLQPTLSLVSTDWYTVNAAGRAEVLTSVQVTETQVAQLQSFVLPANGAYAFVVQSAAAVTGSYRLVLNGQPVSVVGASPITPGYAQHASVSPDNVFNAWTFSATKGSSVAITVSLENRSALAPAIKLLAPDGTLLAQTESRTAQTARLEAYSLTTDGTYTIIVTRALGKRGRTFGGYVLDIQINEPGSRTSIQTTYDRLERRLLDNETFAERWSFAGQSGDVVRIRAETTSGTLDPMLKLYNPEGHLIASSDDTQGVNAEIVATLNVDGSYEVEIARYGGSLGTTEGNYTLLVERVYHLESVTSGPLLVYGDRVVGTTDNRNPSDIWMFAGELGDVVRVQIKFPVDDAPLVLSLRDPSGIQELDGVRGRGSAIIESFTLPSGGLYVIEVRRPGDAQADFSPYELEITLIGAAESEIAQGGNISPGQAVTGGFREVPSTHDWVFQASGGQVVSILLSRLSGMFSLQVMLIAPDGTALFVADSTSGASNALSTGAIELPLDGLYTLMITGQDAVLGSKYRLSIQPVTATSSTERVITTEQDVFGVINSFATQESWYVEVQAGETIWLRAATVEGNLRPTLIIWGPDSRPMIEGSTEATPEGMQTGLAGFTAPITGTYRVVVGRETDNSSGSYRLMLRKQRISSHAAAATDLAFGQPITDYIRGSAPQLYAFQGLAGGVVGLGVQILAEAEPPAITIESENGIPFDLPVVINGDELSIPVFVLPQTGRYVIVLNGSEAAPYSLTVFRREPQITDGASTRNLGRERNFREAVEDASRPTYWIFPGRAGEVVNFTVDTTKSGLRADITLYGPQGYIASATELGDSHETTLGPIRLPDDGSYTVLVGSWLGTSGGTIGQYTIRAEAAPSDVSGSNGGHLAAAGLTVTGGFIPEDTQDVWTYDAAAGEVVTIRAEQRAGDGSLLLKLIGPDGTELAVGETSSAFKGAEIASFTLGLKATYQIVIEGALQEASPVEYRLTLVQDQSPVLSSMKEAAGIGYGETRDGIFSSDRLYQSWIFYGQRGERIASSVITDTDGSIALYLVSSGGEILMADADLITGTAINNFVLAETGFYGLVVAGTENINYTITLERLSAGTIVQGILEGEELTGALTTDAPIHEWEIVPAYSGSYLVQVVSLMPSTPLDMFVLSADDTLLATGIQDEPMITQSALRLEGGEHYTVVVSGGPSGAQGHYKISLTPASGEGTLEVGKPEIGRINSEHFTDSWMLSGQMGQTLVVDLGRIQGNFVPLITLFDDAGTLLNEVTATEDGKATLSFALPKEGSYTLLVSRVGGGLGETSGDYSITARLE